MKDKVFIPVWSIGSFLIVMNTTMFNVSIPDIIKQLHISAGHASWLVSGYSIGFALSTIIFSRLSDFIPIRKLMAIGLSILGLSSILGFFSDSFGFVLLARLLQSCGAGAMPGLGMVLAARYVPIERRGRAIAILASASSLGFGLGPVVGGFITQFLGWHELFLVICLVLPLVLVLWSLLPKESHNKFEFDLIGAVLIVLTTATLLVAVSKLSILFLLISLGSLITFITHLRRARKPFIQPILFKNTGYLKMIILIFLGFALNMSMVFLMPLVLANGFHKPAASVGLLIFPGAVLSAILIRYVGRWIDRYGNLRFLLIGYIFMSLSIIIVSLWIHKSAFIITFAYLLFAPASSTITSAISNEVSRILPKELLGSGMGLSQLSQFMGGSFAVALCGLTIVSQKGSEPILAFQHTYILLLPLLLVSFILLFSYQKSSRADLL
ncbi:MFS transporter [Paenibacillus psychroresistens]|uniref:MFS transporter n=1 Tax=Paenibacillus psychroresistens TaxID=1778678 RepID=A0A6B8RDW9_9BACL|nr:MFS transporter [Paenibacillus psychroresistens]QGQ94117.1 MFS transporter [Paenibacillus psychroresistens]